MRLFVAIDISDELRGLISCIRRSLEGLGRASWVPASNVHLTLKFLGEVSSSVVSSLEEALRGVAMRHAPFELRSGSLGGFPSLARPRVVYLGLEESASLLGLRGSVEDALGALGFQRDGRPFRAHLTLCRVRSPGESPLVGAAAGAFALEKRVAFMVDRFVLYKSELSPRGAVYTALAEFMLGGCG